MLVGIDILEVEYIESMLKKHGKYFLVKYFSQREMTFFKNEKKDRYYLAKRFAAKEAFFKASNLKIEPNCISVLNDPRGKPIFFIKNINVSSIVSVSLTSSEKTCIAFIVMEMCNLWKLKKYQKISMR